MVSSKVARFITHTRVKASLSIRGSIKVCALEIIFSTKRRRVVGGYLLFF
jgi:hypothetical protein